MKLPNEKPGILEMPGFYAVNAALHFFEWAVKCGYDFSLVNSWTSPVHDGQLNVNRAPVLFNGKPNAYASEGIRDACG